MTPPPGSDSLYARGFAADAETERALRAGLAGREVKIQRGRLPVALRTLAAEASPRLVFVDIDGVSNPEAAARELASVCAIGTALIAIGTTDTAHLARSLLRHGIADYLVKPLSAAVVRDASASALDDLPERTYAGSVVAFAGAPGSGVSTLVAATARGIKGDGRSAIVVNLDPISGSLSALLGAREPAGILATLLASLDPGLELNPDDETANAQAAIEPEQLDSVCVPAVPGISVISYPRAGPLPPSPSALAVGTFLRHLANQAHVVLVAGVVDSDTRIEIMRQADVRVLLYEPTLPSISATVHYMALLGADCPSTLVQCHARMRKSALSSAQIRYALAERRPDIVIPFEPVLHAVAVGGKRKRAPGKAYLEAVRQVLERTAKGPLPAAS